MAEDPIRTALHLLEQPIEAPPDLAEEIFSRLLLELDVERASGTTSIQVYARPTTRPPARPAPRRWRPRPRSWLRPRLQLVAAAVAVMGLVVSVLVLLPRPKDALGVVHEAENRLSSAPPFQATVAYDLNPEGARPPAPDVPRGATATLRIWYEPGKGYRQEILAEAPPLPASAASGVGSFVVWDGTMLGTYGSHENDWNIARATAGLDPLREFEWNAPYPDWERICGKAGSEVLLDETIAGRDARHLRCGDEAAGFWELWVDAHTGLVLKEVGALGNDDFHPFATTPRGGFMVTSIEYAPSFPPRIFSVTPPRGAYDFSASATRVPSFEATYTVKRNVGSIREETFRVFYKDAAAFRREVVSVTPSDQDDGTGSFWVWNGSKLGSYEAKGRVYDSNAGDPGAANPRIDLDPTYKHSWAVAVGRVLPWTAFVGRACPSPTTEVVSGREAVHYRCAAAIGTIELWIDVESGLILREVTRAIDIEMLSLQAHPTFAPGTFMFTPPPGAISVDQAANEAYRQTRLRQGEQAPDWSGPLLSGETLGLARLRGKPVLVLFFSDWCLPEEEPACADLPQFQQAFDAWKDRISFVWVDMNGSVDGAQKVVDAGGYTMPVVVDPFNQANKAWGVQSFPLWVLLDADGKVVDVRIKSQTIGQINQMLSLVAPKPSASPSSSA